MRLIILFAILLVSPFLVVSKDEPLLCNPQVQMVDSQRQANLFARYDWQRSQLSVVNWNTGETTRVLETDFPVNSFNVAAWSPSCRYVLVEVKTSEINGVYVWDVITGQRVGMLGGSAKVYRLKWSADDHLLVIQLHDGGYLWNMQTNEQTLLNSVTDAYGRSFYSVEWDTERNELLVVKIGSGNGVTTYNLTTYQQTGFFDIGNRAVPVTYRRLENDRYLLVYSTGREHSFNGLSEGLALWDRDTHTNIQFNPNNVDFALTSFSTFDVLGDLTSRYFIVSDYGVYVGRLYIWDLQNLVGEAPYIPNYHMRVLQAGDIRFLDSSTLEVADWYLWGYGSLTPASLRSTLIDLNIYSQISSTPFTKFESGCDAPSTDIAWACQKASDYSYYTDRNPGDNNAAYYPPSFR